MDTIDLPIPPRASEEDSWGRHYIWCDACFSGQPCDIGVALRDKAIEKTYAETPEMLLREAREATFHAERSLRYAMTYHSTGSWQHFSRAMDEVEGLMRFIDGRIESIIRRLREES